MNIISCFEYLRKIETCIREQIKRRVNSEECLLSFGAEILPSGSLSKNIKIKIHRGGPR